MISEPQRPGLTATHDVDRSVRVRHGSLELARYVYSPWEEQYESPRPYLHPMRTLGGELVSLYRPHDDIRHKGLTWAVHSVGDQNFWGGRTYVRDQGYVQFPNNGSMVHRGFTTFEATPQDVVLEERLDWVTEAGATWFHEERSLSFSLVADAWMLAFSTRLTNVSDDTVVFGSPATKGREKAGYGGLFWRGPRSFTGGVVHLPDRTGGDDLMGERAPWLGFTGHHDGNSASSTVVFVDLSGAEQPTQWFVRSELYAGVGAAPFFDHEVPVDPQRSLTYRYAVVVADGDRGRAGSAALAAAAQGAV